MSLARAGRRTVLVDFDLRRPAFDEVFGLPLEPGVCEVLRQQDTVSALVHQCGRQSGRGDGRTLGPQRLGLAVQRSGGRHVQAIAGGL